MWAGYSVFVTNIPEKLLAQPPKDISANEDEFPERNSQENCLKILVETVNYAEIIIKIYKIRWKVELFFKDFKSTIKLNIIKGKNKNRVLCLIYGKLISIMLCLMIISFASSLHYEGREISIWKVSVWLATSGNLAKAICNGNFEALYSECCKHFKLLSKNKRKRQTTQEDIADLFPWKEKVA